MGENLGVNPVGLGKPSRGLGEIASLTRIYNRNRDHGDGQCRCQGALEASGGFHNHQSRTRFLEPADEGVYPGIIVRDSEALTGGRSKGNIQASFGDIHSHINCSTQGKFSPSLWPILADAGSSCSKARATVRAPPEDNGRDDPGFLTVSLSTKEVSVCRARSGRILRPEPRYKEVKKMPVERTERHRQIRAIKKEARSLNGGRSYLLQGLWACRQAAGLTQRQLAESMG